MKSKAKDEMRYGSLRLPILGPLSIALLALFAIFLTAASLLLAKRIHEDATHNISAARQLYDYRIARTADQLGAVLEAIALNEALLAKMAQKDRTGLQKLATPLFDRLKADYAITHFYFSNAERINILRVHNPEMAGDEIDRYSTMEAERSGELAWGVESGWFGSLTLRVVRPTFFQGRLIGYLELGKEIDHLLSEIASLINLDMSIAIYKQNLHREHWETSMREMGKNSDWDFFPDVVIGGLSGNALPAVAEPFLKNQLPLPVKNEDGGLPLTEYRQHFIAFTPLLNGRGQEIGKLILSKDERLAYQEKYRFLLHASLAAGAIVTILFILFYGITGKVQNEIRHLNRRNRLILQAADEGIVGLDMQGVINFINPTGAAMLGYHPEELVGHQQHALIHHTKPDGSEYAEQDCPILKTLQDGSRQRVDHDVCWRKDGSFFPVDLISAPIFDEGRLIGAVVTFSDISQRLEHQRRIHEGDLRMRAIVDNAYDGIITINTDGLIQSFNPAAARLFGYQQQDVLGQNVKLLIPEPHRSLHDGYITRYLASNVPNIINSNREVEALRKDGSIFPARLSVSEIQLSNERIFMGTVQDITLQKQAEQAIREHAIALERSNQELQNFAYVASHDLQEPLRKIMAFGDRLATRYDDVLDEKGLDYLARMRNAADRMRLLISSLLAYSRVESKAQPFVSVDLNKVLEEVLSDLEARIAETGCEIVVDNLPTLQADSVQMHQLLQNLIGNGLKFRREGIRPRVEVHCRLLNANEPEVLPGVASQKTCIVSVSDNGIGFDNKYIDRIFNIFQRLHTHDEYEGSGIGLAICRKIAQRHNGTLDAEGRPGEGATFILTLPLTQPASPSQLKLG